MLQFFIFQVRPLINEKAITETSKITLALKNLIYNIVTCLLYWAHLQFFRIFRATCHLKKAFLENQTNTPGITFAEKSDKIRAKLQLNFT